MTQKVRQPWMPAEWEPADVSAVQALNRGDASPDAQRRALKWIIERAAMTYDQSFVPGQPDVTQFIEGKRSVGNQIVKLLKLDLAAIKKK
jgi:hypothetical protein